MAIWDPIFSFFDSVIDVFSPVENWIGERLGDAGVEPPYSILVILILSLITSSISIATTRLMLDTKSINAQQEKIRKWNQQRKKAKETADRKMWLRLKREEKSIQSLQRAMLTTRLKPTLFTMLPFLIIFGIMRGLFEGQSVAVLPFRLDERSWSIFYPIKWIGDEWDNSFSALSFAKLYFLTSIAFSSLLYKVFGISQTPGQSF